MLAINKEMLYELEKHKHMYSFMKRMPSDNEAAVALVRVVASTLKDAKYVAAMNRIHYDFIIEERIWS